MDTDETNNIKKEYGGNQIKVLEGLEAVRKRPGMYIGDTGQRGLHHLVYEIVDNSIDESLAGYCKNVLVIVNKDGTVSVEDDGRGIPVDIMPEHGKPAVEIVLTKLHAGGKFDKDSYKVSGGLHGVGISVVNALSETLEVTVKRNGKLYNQKYSRGAPQTELTIIGDSDSTGTKVTFLPDNTIFPEIAFNSDILKGRIKELAYLNKGIKIIFTDKRTDEEIIYQFEGGIMSLVEELNEARTKLHENVIYLTKTDNDVEVEIAMQYTDSYSEMILSFVNSINTIEGGTHLSGLKSALSKVTNSYIKNNKISKEEVLLTGTDFREGLTAVVSIKVQEPQFEGQTKTKLGNSEVKGIVESIVSSTLSEFYEENPTTARLICDKILSASKARLAAQKARDLVRRKSALFSSSLPGKLADCAEKDASKCEIYIVEGDSAGGCFSGDTLVALADGRNLSFKDIIKEQEVGKEHFCYTIKKDGKVGLERIINPRMTKANTDVIKINLDNGNDIICTPDHPFMLRDGTFKPAESLVQDISLMRVFDKKSESIPMSDAIATSNSNIVSIEKIKNQMDVYDIEVPNTHNFALASGIFVHNSAKQGRSRHNQAILPLKGKILNVEKAGMAKMFKSEEITNLITAIGTGVGDQFDQTKLRYHKIIIMTDADVDGAHISTLILTFLYRYMKELVEEGNIYLAMPPLYKIQSGKTITYAYTDKEKEAILSSDELRSSAKIQRYKGLGEMNPDQLWETTMNPETRSLKKISITDAIEADKTFTVLMGDNVEPRRKFIEDHAGEVTNLDV
ncbi:MAG: DNA topoisomerase (ATP-hydrolyzing) subunit B [DPANN group archaeon]|nr:DNA topoisomerase (ATP-hydrolyzing) subunit B [DPANN group archaeon]